jgi:hypothetical protein
MSSEEPGRRDHLITRALEQRLAALESELLAEEPLDPAEGPQRLARHAMERIRGELAGLEPRQAQTLCEARHRDRSSNERHAPAPAAWRS